MNKRFMKCVYCIGSFYQKEIAHDHVVYKCNHCGREMKFPMKNRASTYAGKLKRVK